MSGNTQRAVVRQDLFLRHLKMNCATVMFEDCEPVSRRLSIRTYAPIGSETPCELNKVGTTMALRMKVLCYQPIVVVDRVNTSLVRFSKMPSFYLSLFAGSFGYMSCAIALGMMIMESYSLINVLLAAKDRSILYKECLRV